MSSSRTQTLIGSRKFNINNCNSLKCLTAIAYTLCQAQFIMEELLRKYIVKNFNWENVEILGYNVDGATCCVRYKIDGCRETLNLNIWDMVVFLNCA